jgi:hypothetical protein
MEGELMRYLLLLLLPVIASAQMSISSPFYQAAFFKPAAAAGGGGDYRTGLIFDLDVDGLSGTDGDAMETFSDASGNAHHFSHATAGNRPALTNSTAVLNNKKSLYFDGSSDFMTNRTYAIAAQNYTFIGVFKFDGGYNNFNSGYLLDSGPPSSSLSIRPEDAAFHKLTVYDGTSIRQFAAIATASPIVLSVVMDNSGTSLRTYTNGVACASATAWVQPTAGEFLAIAGAYAGGSHLKGILGDQRLYSGALSDVNRKLAEQTLGTKFGITVAP